MGLYPSTIIIIIIIIITITTTESSILISFTLFFPYTSVLENAIKMVQPENNYSNYESSGWFQTMKQYCY